MAELKPGWKRVKFGEIAECVNDRVDDPSKAGVDRYVGLEHLDPESLTIRRWGAPDEVESTKLRFKPGDIIFGKRRAYQRKLAVADFEGICSAHAMVLRAKPKAVLPEFLPFFMQSDLFMERAVAISVGSLSPTINWKTLAVEQFALPPLEEQRRIATVLRVVEENHDVLLSAIRSLDALEASLLRSEFGEYDPEKLSGHLRLASVATIQSGVAKGRAREAGKTTEVPYLRVANVKDGELDLSEIQEITVEASQVHHYLLRPGDVLMTEGGDLDKLGRGTVWQGEVEGCVHQNHVFAVRPDPRQLDPWYLAALARSGFGRCYFQKCAKRTSNLASVNKRELGEFPVQKVSLERQRVFVETWRSLRNQRLQFESRGMVLRQLMRQLIEADHMQ